MKLPSVQFNTVIYLIIFLSLFNKSAWFVLSAITILRQLFMNPMQIGYTFLAVVKCNSGASRTMLPILISNQPSKKKAQNLKTMGANTLPAFQIRGKKWIYTILTQRADWDERVVRNNRLKEVNQRIPGICHRAGARNNKLINIILGQKQTPW